MMQQERSYRKSRFEYGDGISDQDRNGNKSSNYILFHSHFPLDAGQLSDARAWDVITRNYAIAGVAAGV